VMPVRPEPFPKKDPLNADADTCRSTSKLLSVADEPDTITFFQDAIV